MGIVRMRSRGALILVALMVVVWHECQPTPAEPTGVSMLQEDQTSIKDWLRKKGDDMFDDDMFDEKKSDHGKNPQQDNADAEDEENSDRSEAREGNPDGEDEHEDSGTPEHLRRNKNKLRGDFDDDWGIKDVDNLEPSKQMLDPGKSELKELNKDVASTLGKIRHEEALLKRRDAESQQLESEAAQEKQVSAMRQQKFEHQIEEEDADEEKKSEAGEEDEMKKEEEKETKSKPPKKEEMTWDITVDKEKGVISAEQPNPKIHERHLHFNKYTDVLTEEEKAKMQQLQALDSKSSAAHCDKCKQMCKTTTCRNWCDLRWCGRDSADIDIDEQPLESQENIVNAAKQKDVNPATAMVCKDCQMVSSEEKAKWCKEQGC